MEYSYLTNGLLYYGILEKKRDGAVRGGWIKRIFILTTEGLYYYRRTNDQDLLGVERGQIMLKDITNVQSISQDNISPYAIEGTIEYHYIEISTKIRSYLMRLLKSDKLTCDRWVQIINEQIDNNKNNKMDKNNQISYKHLNSNQKEKEKEKEKDSNVSIENNDKLLSSLIQKDPPEILFISAIGLKNYSSFSILKNNNENDNGFTSEWMIDYNIKWGNEIDIGILSQGGACIITMNNNNIARIGTHALLSCWDSGKHAWIDVLSNNKIVNNINIMSLEISVICETNIEKDKLNTFNNHTISTTTTTTTTNNHSNNDNTNQFIKKIIILLHTVEEYSSMGFLIMCLFVHLLYGVDNFHWTHKLDLTVGAALAITSFISSSTLFSQTISNDDMNNDKHNSMTGVSLPEVHFKITIHRCKIKNDKIEYLYPEK